MARAAHFISDFKTASESDPTTDNFLQWLVQKQSEEVALLERLLQAFPDTGESDLLRMKQHAAHERPWERLHRTQSNRPFCAFHLVRNVPYLAAKAGARPAFGRRSESDRIQYKGFA
jgi:hypothetical protein